MRPSDIDAIIKERTARAAQERAQDRVFLNADGVKKNDITSSDARSDINEPPFGRRCDADYLPARIARDRPDILDRMKAGGFQSVRAAIDLLNRMCKEDEAMDYAIANQRDRRSLTNGELDRLVVAVDKRRQRGNHKGNQHTGVQKASNEAIFKSADVTAELAGTSRAKVEKIRVITNLLAGEVATGEGLSGLSEKRLSVSRMRGMSVFALL
jgi:hypothetical protein